MAKISQSACSVWRVCRVLANRPRLKILGLVVRQPGQTLSVVARSVNLTVGIGSLYVRALESDGLLRTQPRGPWKECWPAKDHEAPLLRSFIAALNDRLRQDKKAVEAVFRLATAFTHPRRVDIYRELRGQARTVAELRSAVGIPGRALLRHLNKLRDRGFVAVTGKRPQRRYAITRHLDSFGRALGSLVLQNE